MTFVSVVESLLLELPLQLYWGKQIEKGHIETKNIKKQKTMSEKTGRWITRMSD